MPLNNRYFPHYKAIYALFSVAALLPELRLVVLAGAPEVLEA